MRGVSMEVSSYSRLRDQLTNLGREFHSWLTKPQYIAPFLQPGRLVRIKSGDQVRDNSETPSNIFNICCCIFDIHIFIHSFIHFVQIIPGYRSSSLLQGSMIVGVWLGRHCQHEETKTLWRDKSGG